VDSETPQGLREQIAATVSAIRRLARAHVDLARAEAGEIVGEVKRIVGLAAAAVGLLLVVAVLLFVGGVLFLGDWLFGSIGWGVLLGTLLLIDLAVVAALLAVGIAGSRLGRDVVIAVVIAVATGLVLGFDLTHRAWSALADAVVPTADPGLRVTAVAVLALAIVAAAVAFVARLRGGVGAAFGAAVGAAVLGAIVGLITAASIAPQVGAALGALVGLLAWPALSGMGVARRGVDGEALKAKFTPDETIDEAKETIEWVRARLPLAPKS
jgi:hypothetical protein